MKRRLFTILVIFVVLMVVGIAVINVRVSSYSTDRIYQGVDDVPAEGRVAIVLGARVGKEGVPSNTLYDRTLTGIELYKAGKAARLLFSGGNDEPVVMKKMAVAFGVPESDIVLDDEGLRTFDSCSRAKNTFGIDRAIVVTQDYHLSRSIYLCQSMGVDAVGINAKRRDYDGERYAWLREYISRVLAWYDVNFT